MLSVLLFVLLKAMPLYCQNSLQDSVFNILTVFIIGFATSESLTPKSTQDFIPGFTPSITSIRYSACFITLILPNKDLF